MADSIRKQITDAILQRLDGAPMDNAPSIANKRINKNRSLPPNRNELPMYSVYFMHEAPKPAGNMRRPVLLDRKLLIEVRVIVSGTDDDADPHCQWVTSRLGNGAQIQSQDGSNLTMSISELETIFDTLEGSEGKVTLTGIRWTVEYHTNPGDITRLT